MQKGNRDVCDLSLCLVLPLSLLKQLLNQKASFSYV